MSKLTFALILIRLGLVLIGRGQIAGIKNEARDEFKEKVKNAVDSITADMERARNAPSMPVESDDPHRRD